MSTEAMSIDPQFSPSMAPTSSPDAMSSAGHLPFSSLVMAGATHPSSWSYKQQKEHAEALKRAPWQTGDEMLAMKIAATVSAVQQSFAHLEFAEILAPPHAWFDAALARQIMIFVLRGHLDTPRRVIAAVSLMSQANVNRAMHTVWDRCETPRFAEMVRLIEQRAAGHFRLWRLN